MKIILKITVGLLHYGLIIATGILLLLVIADYLTIVFTAGASPNPISGLNWTLVFLLVAGAFASKFLISPLFYGIEDLEVKISNRKNIEFDDEFLDDNSLINPATGLDMNGGIDGAGNLFGEDGNWN